MKNIKTYYLSIIFSLIYVYADAQYTERLNFNAKFEPADKVIHMAGQSDEFAFAGYVEVMGTERHLWLLGTCDHLNNQDINIYATGENWDENTLNWNNKPALKQLVRTINVNDEGKYDIYQAEITQLLKDSLAAGKQTFSFAISEPAVEDVEYFFHTKEMTPDYPPTLQIIHNSDAMQYDQCDAANSGHPFLIVNRDMYADMREKASQSPWKEMKDSARSLFSQHYDETLEDGDDKAILLRDITSAGTLLWILEPDSQDVYMSKIVETLYKFNDVMASRSDPPTDWSSTVPLACAAFNAIITLDVLYDDIAAADRDSIEKLYFNFLDNQRSTAWRESYYASLGIYYLYKGDREKTDYYKGKYRKELEDNLTDDGIFNGGTGYSTSRYLKDEREQKYYFMDVLEFTGEDNYYNDPLFQQLHEWLFAHNFNTYGSIYIFGDAKMGTSIRGRLEESAGTWRVNRFSKQAAQNAAWQVQGKTPEGRLLIYLAVDSLTDPVRPNTSEIYPDGGAWFVHNPSNNDHVSGVLWNPMSYSDHAHKEVNSLHLSAYGEDLVVNSGYSNWGNGALGFPWNYIHDQAKASNTVLIDNRNHNKKSGSGIKTGFIIEDKMSYATGVAGSALLEGSHERSLISINPVTQTRGYWVVFDEVNAYNPAHNTQILFHPRSSDITSVTDAEEYRWTIQRWSEHGTGLSVFYSTPPTSTPIKEGVQADKSNSLLCKYVKAEYETDATGNKQIVSVLFPVKNGQSYPEIDRYQGSDFTGSRLNHGNNIIDYHVESTGETDISLDLGAVVRGKFQIIRTSADTLNTYFGMDASGFMYLSGSDTIGFTSEWNVSLFLHGTIGKITSMNSVVTFYYPGIKGVLLDDDILPVVNDGINAVTVNIPAGTHNLQLEIGAKENYPVSTNSDFFEHNQIDVYPVPAKNTLYVRKTSRNIDLLSIEVYSIYGKKMVDLTDMAGKTDLKIPINGLKNGTYIVKIQGKCNDIEFYENHKILILK